MLFHVRIARTCLCCLTHSIAFLHACVTTRMYHFCILGLYCSFLHACVATRMYFIFACSVRIVWAVMVATACLCCLIHLLHHTHVFIFAYSVCIVRAAWYSSRAGSVHPRYDSTFSTCFLQHQVSFPLCCASDSTFSICFLQHQVSFLVCCASVRIRLYAWRGQR